MDGALDETSLRTIVSTLFDEGCVGETFAAALAREELERTADPAARSVLARIAEDEARHGVLAWRALAWMLETQDREVVSSAVAERVAALSSSSPRDGSDDAPRAPGLLGASDVAALRRASIRDVVLPCVRALLARSAPRVAQGADCQ
jgi:hypothetical protein